MASFVLSPVPKYGLSFTAACTFVCLDFPGGINHTNRGPLDSLGEPSPLKLNTCPILQAVQSRLHTLCCWSEVLFSAKLILGENFLCATVQPFRLNRQRKNSEVKGRKGSFCAAEERRDCSGSVAAAVVPTPREMLGNGSSCSLCPDLSLFFSLLGWCCELVWPPNAHLVLFGPQVGLWYLACIAAFI